MKILLLSEFFPQDENGDITGGVEARNFYLAKYAKKSDLTIFAGARKSDTIEQKIFNAKVKRVGPSYSYSQQGSLIKRLLFVIACIKNAKGKYDFVEGTNFITHLAAILIGKIYQIPVILWYPDVWVGSWVKILGLKGIIGEVIERTVLCFGKSAKFIAISGSTKDKLIKNKINEENITVIPCGVDEEEIQKTKKEKISKTYDLIAVNRLVKYKNTERVIKVAIKNSHSLLVVGEGPERENLEKIIAENNFQNKIKIIPKIDNHLDLLRQVAAAKVFVSASLVEGFDIAAIEAAAMGLTCLLSDIPPHLELSIDSPNILIFHSEKEFDSMIALAIRGSGDYSVSDFKIMQKYNWHDIINSTEITYEHYKK